MEFQLQHITCVRHPDNANPCREGFAKFPLQPIVYCCSHREGFPRADIKLYLPLAATGVSANST